MPEVHIKLIDRSKIAKEFGGPEMIRKLPLEERLRVCAKIAKELGKEKAAERCATLAVKKSICKSDYKSAEITATEHNLTAMIQFLDAVQKIV